MRKNVLWSTVAPLTALYSLLVATTLSVASKEGQAIEDYSAQQVVSRGCRGHHLLVSALQHLIQWKRIRTALP